MTIYRLGVLLNYLDFSMGDFRDIKPTGVTENTLIAVMSAQRPSENCIVFEGYLAETIIDERISVIPTGPDDSIAIEDIALPQNEFTLEFVVTRKGRSVRFLKFNNTPL